MRTLSLDKLRREACDTLEWRGHIVPMLLDWTQLEGNGRTRHARRTFEWTCPRCGHSVVLDNQPPPNGIDIGGSAVALDCEGR